MKNFYKLCVTRNIWVKLDKALNEVLDSTTLQDLVKWQKAKDTRRNNVLDISLLD